jgi:hypothetical protein
MLSLSITQNKTGVFFLTVTQSDGVTPQDLTGSTLWFHAATGGFQLNKSSSGNGITITNATGGLATLQIEPGDTAALSLVPSGTVAMPCELSLQNGSESYELNTGLLVVTANVGTP